MNQIQILARFAESFMNPPKWEAILKQSGKAMEMLLAGNGAGNEFLGWVNLPSSITNDELVRIEKTAERIRNQSEYLVVVGIGGSYLGARAVIESLSNPFDAYRTAKSKTKILYAGHHLDPDYHRDLLDFLAEKDFSVNVISKSGTTTEPAVAFRLLIDLLEKKYGKDGTKTRVIATTDSSKGALKKFSDDYGFETYIIPDDVGGRYSVLTPVGLIPIAVTGANIRQLVAGAQSMQKSLTTEKDPTINLACRYASLRNTLYLTGKKIEILVNYNPALHFIAEWWKQLYGESEGKGKKGIFPASVDLTTDLHSMGQYLQDGERTIFETVIRVESPKRDINLTARDSDNDGLNYLSGKTLSWVGSNAALGTLVAHTDGGVPCIEIVIPQLDEENIGALLYFFEFACGVSGYILGVNPFDQPGVEDYKNNMFALLGKKGFEDRKAEIEKKIL